MLTKKQSNGVYICDEGYLMEDFTKPYKENLNKNVKAINDFPNKHKDINQYMFIAPNAIIILDDKLPAYASVLDQKKYLDDLNKSLDKKINFIR